MITTFFVPHINANDDRVEIVSWYVSNGGYVAANQEIVDVETSKTVQTIYSEKSGWIKPLVKIHDVIKVGTPLFLIAESENELSDEYESSNSSTDVIVKDTFVPHLSEAVNKQINQKLFAETRFSEPALSLLEEKNIPQTYFPNAGLVTARMINAALTTDGLSNGLAATEMVPIIDPATNLPKAARIESIRFSKISEINSLAQGMSGNITSILSVALDTFKIRELVSTHKVFGGNLQPIFLYELSRLLKKWPKMTSFFNEDKLYYYDRVDLGLALDHGSGLRVVTIPYADQLMPKDFYDSTLEFNMRYMRNELNLNETTGSTFTVSDLSSLNIPYFHPLINGYQSAILGIGADDSKSEYPVTFNLTFDHRILSGREVAEFLNELKKAIGLYANADNELYSSL